MRPANEEIREMRQNMAVSPISAANALTKAIDLNAVAQAAIRIHHRSLESKKVKLFQDLPGGMMVRVPMLPIFQVVSNVMGNALSTLSCGGALSLRLRRSQDRVHLLIASDGYGSSEEDIREAFLPLGGYPGERGAGPGLALSKSILERHQGTMVVRSSTRPEQAGTTFRISLPSCSKGASSGFPPLESRTVEDLRMTQYTVVA
jgi:C4-dicarboxylate-specific signal transduction histidine kinase